jgi:hypothetical protein
MKNRLLTLVFLTVSFVVNAQTNTFPATGNVGIGTISPVGKLVISNAGLNGLEIDPITGWNGGTNIISYNRSLSLYTPLQLVGSNFSFGTSSVASGMSILNNGNIGIGSISPAYKLVVSNSGANGLEIDPVSGLNAGTNIISYNRNTTSYTPLQILAHNLIIGTSAVAIGMSLLNNGNVGIGTSTPTEKLSVNGNFKAQKVIVSQTGWPDYVFDHAYPLRPLSELSAFIQKYKHLPDMPSAKEVTEKGINVGDNQALLLKKIEEMTLYIISMNNEIEKLKGEKIKLKSK